MAGQHDGRLQVMIAPSSADSGKERETDSGGWWVFACKLSHVDGGHACFAGMGLRIVEEHAEARAVPTCMNIVSVLQR